MSNKNNCSFISLTVRGIRESNKRRNIFASLKIKKHPFIFCKIPFLIEVMNHPGDMNGEVK